METMKEDIENWQVSSGVVCAHWDGCITVDEELFHEGELKKK